MTAERGAVVLALALLLMGVLAADGSAANFGAHVGLAEDTQSHPYFVAGALLADLDHFLPTGEPPTDTPGFARGMLVRAWGGTANAWWLVRGWYEHIDQDTRFVAAVGQIQAAFPSYTTTDVRLAFDYWTVTKHPFSTALGFMLADSEIHELIAGGLVGTDPAGVRSAIGRLLYSTDLNAPGLFLQVNASKLYGFLYPQIVRDVEPFYDAFYAGATAGWVDPFPPLERILRTLHIKVRRLQAGLVAMLEPHILEARGLVRDRPLGWLPGAQGALLRVAEIAQGMAGPGPPGSSAVSIAELARNAADALRPPP